MAKRFTDITTTTTHNNNYCYNKNNNKKNTNKNNNDKKNNTAYLLREKKTSSLYCWEYTLQYLYWIHINKVHVKKLKCFEDGKNIPFNQGFLICRAQKLLIRSQHLKVSDWGRRSSPESATDWNK